LHSYLQGAGIEIMANSDNVLRGGLTTKYVDICELLRIVDFQPQIIRPIKPHKVLTKEKLYQTTAKEFALSFIRHISHKMTVINRSDSPEILFCYTGSFVIENCSQFLTLEQGQSVFVPYETEGYVIDGKGILYRARVNS